ncbi:hypothetical protein D3C71_1523210 [compost metagenome]
MLGRLGLQLAGGGDVRHQGQVHEQRLLRAALGAHLADRLQERQRLDVTHGAADLHQRHVEAFSGLVDAAADFVGDMRNDLHGGAQVIAPALLADHVLVDTTGGDRILSAQPGMHETLVVAQVQIGLGTVVGDVDLTMLERTHRAWIDIDVRIQLHHRDLQATRLENRGQGRGCNALAKRGHHTTGNKNKGGHGSLPPGKP